MFGYACDDTPELMPLPIHLAHRLSERLSAVRKSGEVAYLRPDGKTQVTIGYDGDRAVRLDTVVLSTQHAADVSLERPARARHRRARHRAGPRRARATGTDLDVSELPQRSSTRPAASRSAARWVTPASPAARSSSTPTAAWPATVAAPSPARTRARSTARRPTRCAGSPRTSSPPGSPAAARCRSPTPSARPSRSACTSRRSAPRPSRRQDPGRDRHGLRPAPGRDHRRARPAAPDLPADRGLRPLRPHVRADGLENGFTWERTDRVEQLQAAVAG